MFITHITPLDVEPGIYKQLPFLCADQSPSNIFQIGFQPMLTLTLEEVRENERLGSVIVLSEPILIEDESRIPWLDPSGHIWLLHEKDPLNDPRPKYISLLR